MNTKQEQQLGLSHSLLYYFNYRRSKKNAFHNSAAEKRYFAFNRGNTFVEVKFIGLTKSAILPMNDITTPLLVKADIQEGEQTRDCFDE